MLINNVLTTNSAKGMFELAFKSCFSDDSALASPVAMMLFSKLTPFGCFGFDHPGKKIGRKNSERNYNMAMLRVMTPNNLLFIFNYFSLFDLDNDGINNKY